MGGGKQGNGTRSESKGCHTTERQRDRKREREKERKSRGREEENGELRRRDKLRTSRAVWNRMEFRRLSRVKNCRSNFHDALRPIKRLNKYGSSNRFAHGLWIEPQSEKATGYTCSRVLEKGSTNAETARSSDGREGGGEGKLFVGNGGMAVPKGGEEFRRKNTPTEKYRPVEEPKATILFVPFKTESSYDRMPV